MNFRPIKILFPAIIALASANCAEPEAPRQLEPLLVPGLTQPVRVLRDDWNMAYIYADSLSNAFRAQGFITARDRLFQLTMLHRTINGRLGETIGEPGLNQDRITHILNIPGIAARQAALISDDTRAIMQAYIDGVNAYIDTMADDYPPALAALGITPDRWTVEDQMAMLLLLNWGSNANWKTELVTLQIIDKVGAEKAAEIHQLSINPDDESGIRTLALKGEGLDLKLSPLWTASLFEAQHLGSNNWVVSGGLTASGKPILANDPHLALNTLPGTWYPVGIITPDFRAVGASSGWSPGIFVGRTAHIAMGVTNAYGDVADLTIEQLDPDNPDHYLEDGQSIPLAVRTVTVRVKDPAAETGFREEIFVIRSTPRGPLVSDHGMAVAGDKALSLRWSAGAFLTPEIGIDGMLFAKTVEEARQAVQNIDASITMAFADKEGNIGHQSTGAIPIRVDGAAPYPPRSDNAWRGRIPRGKMPGVTNPARGWAGSANHRMISPDYPYYYSSYSAHSWRYRRLIELLDGAEATTAEEQWRNQRDATNMMARRLLPLILPALAEDHELAVPLRAWDGIDRLDSAAPTVFQALIRHLTMETFKDELGAELTARMLFILYYWQDRFETLLAGNSPWFDDQATEEIEHRDSLIRRAAALALAELKENLGPDQSSWQWGSHHRIAFKSPVPGAPLPQTGLSAGPHPMGGSSETLYRASTIFGRPYDVTYGASMRMVVDMADPDKIMAVLPGGVSGRAASPHLNDQAGSWLNGEIRYWWFSDKAIAEHAVTERTLHGAVSH